MGLFDNAQWFQSLGSCLKCGKAANGRLMSHRNASIGPFCRRCAEAAIKAAHKKGGFAPDAVAERRDARRG